ncbi:IS110 family transposase [Nocardia sp. NBC_00881]|uniref:IS110 family transposase n=1 Tax=Nocardia sp. NBC_00881 TaxID=2975995 RepID=UPI00386EC7B8|nr:IS110 family transposase [Nocardia sp. NBC_00881]WSY62486.1 IS110 family transposase [Nocardia sp. NBC_00881]WSY62915.1 IS110 family transposase [Nocardia sp. NBC_00881]WSY64150.1 IS110 family transposase [Nocardia sp. NBC_00881]WSY64187.1 IS110 family transposase [Nocardia sp. NBC_00881]
MFAGWDWGTVAHDVTVIDDAGGKVERFAPPHTEDGIARALARLATHGDPGTLPVAIETTRGLVVDRLLAAGHPVIPVHPNAFHAARPRWGAARAKNDPGDSFKLADYIRTDIHRLPTLAPTLAQTLELQALTRQRGDHLGLRIAAVNQLSALLDAHWPGGRTIFANLHSPIALAFLDRYPNPESAASLTAARLEAFCRRRSYSGRRCGAELLARLRDAPTSASRLGQPIIAQLIRAQVAAVRSLQTSLDQLDTVIAEAATAHPYARLLADLPRIGVLNLAQIIGEIGPILERANSFDQLAAETGLAPVTRASGKTHTVAFRHATNHHARQALVTWIDNSRRASDWADQRYTAARQRGQRHPHAIRTLGRAWLRIIWACWRTKTAYDPGKHQPGQRPIAA